ncbi:MAG: glycine cleavage system H-protein subunit [Cirrosporium novae-zelandiae]|nr:MAG: glycine cleavage system H-protein subunit [Cirrosporium novae-zelandiae]
MATIARIARPVQLASRFASVPVLRLRGGSIRSPVRHAIERTQPLRSFTAATAWQVKKYTEDHEWIELSEDGTTGTIGITEYAANALGDVVFVELPTADLEVKAGDTMGAVESVKSASDIMSPVSGKVIETNNVLESKPGTINKSPEGDGWVAKLAITDKAELDNLKSMEEYKAFIEEEE